eukprot:scaffold88320_cov54-Phaeocystis_antarctica.AAC.4
MPKARPTPEWRRAGFPSARGWPGRHLGACSSEPRWPILLVSHIVRRASDTIEDKLKRASI